MLTEEQANEIFAKWCTDDCPECGKPAGELCNTNGVWVHLERMTQSTAWKDM